MELTKEFIENSLTKALDIFEKSDVGLIDNEVKIDFIDSDKFIEDAMENQVNKTLLNVGIIKDFKKEYPGFLVVYYNNKLPMRKLLGLPYYISIDFNRAKRLLRPFSRVKVEQYLISVFLHEITHVFEDSVIEKHKVFYNKQIEICGNNKQLANEALANAVSYLYGYKEIEEKITKELYKDMFSKMKKIGFNPNNSDDEFKQYANLF